MIQVFWLIWRRGIGFLHPIELIHVRVVCLCWRTDVSLILLLEVRSFVWIEIFSFCVFDSVLTVSGKSLKLYNFYIIDLLHSYRRRVWKRLEIKCPSRIDWMTRVWYCFHYYCSQVLYIECMTSLQWRNYRQIETIVKLIDQLCIKCDTDRYAWCCFYYSLSTSGCRW